jgi:hypothetical protein
METDNIKIMPTMKFDLEDLIKKVDFSHPFTLRGVLKACLNSEIPIKILESILHCNCIEELCKEAESKPFCDDGDIEYLEVYWWGSKGTYDGVKDSSNSWGFHGVGYLNRFSDDVIEMYKYMEKELPKNFRENYAIEFTPMFKMADYQIKMSPKLIITDYDLTPKEEVNNDIEFTPYITLIDLLYAIFFELSLFGSISRRDDEIEKIEKTLEECRNGIEEGTLKTISLEELEKEFDKEE